MRILQRSWMLTLLIALMATASVASAQTWVGAETGTADYNTSGNWSPAAVPDAAGASAQFSGLDVSSPVEVALSLPVTLGDLQITGSQYQANFSLTDSEITFDNGGSGATMLIQQTGALNAYTFSGVAQQVADVLIAGDVVLNDNLAVTINNDDSRRYLQLDGNITDLGTNAMSFTADAATTVIQDGDVTIDSLVIGENVTYRKNGATTINSLTVQSGGTISAGDAFLSSFTLGTNATLGAGAMIAHSDLDASGTNTIQNLGMTPQFIYGIRGDTYGEGSGNTGTPVTLEVGTGSSGPWAGIGADTTYNSGNPRQHSFGTDLDTVNLAGDMEIRTTSGIKRDKYSLGQSGMMSLNAKLTGGAPSSMIDVTGPGIVIVTNNENTVRGTWNVTGGAVLRPDLFGDSAATNTQDVLGDAENDIILDNGTLAFRAGGNGQEADLQSTRSITIGPGGGEIYLDYGTNYYNSGSTTALTSKYAFQSAVVNGDVNPNISQPPAPLAVIEEYTIGQLNLNTAGQLAGTGTLVKDGRGTLFIADSNVGFSGDVHVKQGSLIAAKSDSIGSSGTITVDAGAIYANGPNPSAADVARVTGEGIFALGGSYGGTIDFSSENLWLHSWKPGSDNVTVDFANITPNAGLGYQFGGAGGVLFVDGSWGADDVTIQGPGVTILTGDNSASTGSLDFTAGGLGIGSDLAIGGSPSAKKVVTLDWSFSDANPPKGLLYANGQHGASINRGYEIELAGGQVGFVGGFTLTSLDQLGVIQNLGGVSIVGIGFNGDSGTVDASAVDITDVDGNATLLIKRGSDSTLDLRGSANTYTQQTFIYAGDVLVDNGNQLSSNRLALYAQAFDNTSPATLRLTGTMNWTGSRIDLAQGARISEGSREATIEVDAGATATLNADLTTQVPSARLNKTGEGTLVLDGIANVSAANKGWGLRIQAGQVQLNQLPNGGEGFNGALILEGGDLTMLAASGLTSAGAGEGDVDYGFLGMVVKEATSSTVSVENGGLLQITGGLNSPFNSWKGEIVFAGANETSAGADDWGVFRINDSTAGLGWSSDSEGTLTIQSGHFKALGLAKPRFPLTSGFTLNVLGGKITESSQGVSGALTLDDGDALTVAPQIADLNVYGSGDTTWNGTVVVTGNTFELKRSGGTVSVAADSTLQINDGGSALIGGSVNTLTDGVNNVTVINDGTFTVSGSKATPAVTAATEGLGQTNLNAGSTLSVELLEQLGLSLGDNATLELLVENANSIDSLSLGTDSQIAFAAAGTMLSIADSADDYTEAELNALLGSVFVNTSGDANLAVGLKQLTDADPSLLMLTLKGDANLDGAVSIGDLGILAGNYGTLGGATWDMGDFNGDGNVTIGDLGILAGLYGQQLPVSAPLSVSVVPEPATMGLLGLGGLAMLRRRRR
ncbi:MAG: beta strand repeat-containing protein, partial [Phycisphaerae bacterium]